VIEQDTFSLAGRRSRESYKKLPRKEHLNLAIKAAQPVQSARIDKSEQASKSRWHLEVKLPSAKEIDRELPGWLREAYALCG
jgi:Domain of unknown function (DUF5655)